MAYIIINLMTTLDLRHMRIMGNALKIIYIDNYISWDIFENLIVALWAKKLA